ncbi:hypothetical protein ACGFR6_04565 [Streptomyces sp. NPDC048567]|uniref:hypothetical protein n=1 Tax=Streptomyces sp. NPDC048567 TaxID=3365570 RepID=UPI003714E857
MTSANVLRILGVAPCALDPAPPWTPCGTAHVARLAERHPCIRCGATATVAGVVEDSDFGRRWLDRCTACLVATTPRGPGPRPPVENLLAPAVRAAPGEIGEAVTVVHGGGGS